MAKGKELESPHNDLSPLLNDPNSSSQSEQVLTINPTSTLISFESTNVVLPHNLHVPTIQNEVIFSEPCCNILTTQEAPTRKFSSIPTLEGEPSSNASTSSSRPWTFNTNEENLRQQTSFLNSPLWIGIEFTITFSQIIASIVVLALSNLDDLLSLLSIWIIGYTTGCLATLPLLYWRYQQRFIALRGQEILALQHISPSEPTTTSESNSYMSYAPNPQDQISQTQINNLPNSDDNRFHLFIQKFKIGLDCYFAIWFIVGNIWVFGPHSSTYEEPTLYKLCVILLSFSCIAYAMPFIMCTTICCCLPCIVALLGHYDEPHRNRGASEEIIASLPRYNFKPKISNNVPDVNNLNKKENEGSIIAQDKKIEKVLPSDDALCSICLASYKDNVELRELPCSHHFHVECVDIWLKINASCPLCKYEIGGPSELCEMNPF